MKTKLYIFAIWLRERIVPVAIYLLEGLVFMMISALYGYEGVLHNMTYALELVMFLGGCYLLWNFIRFRAKYRELQELFLAQERSDDLPQVSFAMEQAYQQIIRAQEAEKRALITQLDERQQNMADYYTMWTHQIKVPLSAMDLLLQNAEDIADGSQTAENDVITGTNASEMEDDGGGPQIVKQLREEVFKTEQYVDMALHYARMESLSSDLSFTRLDVDGLVKKALKKYWLLFSGAGIRLQLNECHAQVVTDGKWLSFVIEQILSNAIKYTKDGTISIYGMDKDGGRVTDGCVYLVIEDTGIGIAESDLPRIFERGFTGYNGRLGEKSTGIGLYLCRQIMDRLGLSIRVESKRGEGTKVFLSVAQEEIIS